MNKKKLIKKIKIAMLDSDFNQKDLGKKLGVQQTMISHWITGDRNPSLRSLKKIAQATNKPLSYFLPFLDDSENVSGNNNISNSSVGAIVGHKSNGNTVHVNPDLENYLEKNSEMLKKDIEKIVEKNSEMLNLKLELILEKFKKNKADKK